MKGTPKKSKAHWFTYQSGIQFRDGRPKPSFTAYYFPFLARKAGGSLRLWGQLKFRPAGAQDTVIIQRSGFTASAVGAAIGTAWSSFAASAIPTASGRSSTVAWPTLSHSGVPSSPIPICP